MGASNSVAHFQREMQKALSPIARNTTVYLDDILLSFDICEKVGLWISAGGGGKVASLQAR